jgi:hypothetical protein
VDEEVIINVDHLEEMHDQKMKILPLRLVHDDINKTLDIPVYCSEKILAEEDIRKHEVDVHHK